MIKKDYWRVLVATFEESQALLAQLDFRHRERITKKILSLSLHKGDRWISVSGRVEEIRKAIRTERDLFVAEAERVYLKTHDNPRLKAERPDLPAS